MATTQCNHDKAELVESSGGVKEGTFTERYKCPCGATGTIRGDAEAPATEWTRTGRVFNE